MTEMLLEDPAACVADLVRDGLGSGLSWGLRAQVAEFLAFSLRYPTEELTQAVSSGEWGQAAREACAALGAQVPEGFARDAGAGADNELTSDPEELLHILRAEATRLFIAAAPMPAASPYESVQRSEKGDALLFVDETALQVESFMRQCGMVNASKAGLPMDHIAAELELLEYLAALEAGIASVPVEGVRQGDMPGGSAGAAYERFASEHAAKWFGSFARKLQDASGLAFYRESAYLLQLFAANL